MLTSTPIDPWASCSLPVTPSSSRMSSPIVNPLVSTGLVPPDLGDILSTPSEDAAVVKKRTKRITGARALTANEYVEMLREERKKEKEDQKKQKAKEQVRKKQERQNRKWKLSKEKTQRDTCHRVHFDSSSENENTAAVNSVIAVSSFGPSDKDGVQNSPDSKNFALNARDSYLLLFVRTVTVM